MKIYSQIHAHFLNVPLAMHPHFVKKMISGEKNIFANTFLSNGNNHFSHLSIDKNLNENNDDVGYDLIENIAIISINGLLVQKLGSVRPINGITGYDGIRIAFQLALTDPKVKGIILDIDSGGGEVAGCFDLADAIYAARDVKPIWAVLTEYAYSAAYAIASAAQKIIVPRTGGTGSIGVICLHTDISKALTDEGIEITLIHYGEHKTDASEFKPLSNNALKTLQNDVDQMGELFIETVARNRAQSSSKIRQMQAATYLGQASIESSLADGVMPPDHAFFSLLHSLS